MTEQELKECLRSSVFKVLRISEEPPMEEFLKMKNSEIAGKLEQGAPEVWGSFWKQTLADQIEKDLRAEHKVIIEDFDHTWFDKEDKTVQDLVDFALEPGRLQKVS
jgi:hypothetical protein